MNFDIAFIVDDDPIHQFGMKVLLKKVKLSKEILVYHNGQEAIDALLDLMEKGGELPSIIFLDLNMPIKDGWGFLDDFVKIPHNNRRKVVVYVVSSSINPTDQERAKEYEVVSNYMVKPIHENQLTEVLEELGLIGS
ncbi:response regulator [Flagellimonas pelagia]|uniref:Response regulator n=1 Tax=Flagellimonas pelagia TaxID=2306998 RepID=A0A3A1NJ30_9FLAO|nr:response regulator [Allomuricauda maritima]RIV45658.1 response regulator [Allomuricauda maritima]TXJ98000.1 response regulator [Allomuricauda maritima]